MCVNVCVYVCVCVCVYVCLYCCNAMSFLHLPLHLTHTVTLTLTTPPRTPNSAGDLTVQRLGHKVLLLLAERDANIFMPRPAQKVTSDETRMSALGVLQMMSTQRVDGYDRSPPQLADGGPDRRSPPQPGNEASEETHKESA